jgi:hypothetical protein
MPYKLARQPRFPGHGEPRRGLACRSMPRSFLRFLGHPAASKKDGA